ncbi:anti-sigma factor [Lapillicoccus jejuensis]|uniref:Regulator of SigK n=1 Tax=Lapillicoccus jejuensis TaxID=402171 RepID=A0A542DZN5_9MICO|nr:anti-sigma factor [Lapillicoccus jejuensis]TQJ08545.1 anti-sigma-K factor RskA [Lapillicoccus jejuensis]
MTTSQMDTIVDDSVHALTGAYAVDAVDDVERARFERHLEQCADCRAEVASLKAAAAELGLLAEVTPPERLRDQVLADIRTVRPLPPEVEKEAARRVVGISGASRESRRRPARPTRWLIGAAAAAVLAVGAGTLVTQLRGSDVTGDQTVASRVLADPQAVRRTQDFPGGASAEVVSSAATGRAVVVLHDMPDAPAGKVYQTWFQDGDGFRSAGVVPGAGSQTVVLDGDARQAQAVGITVEPTGGSAQPTSKPIALMSLT